MLLFTLVILVKKNIQAHVLYGLMAFVFIVAKVLWSLISYFD